MSRSPTIFFFFFLQSGFSADCTLHPLVWSPHTPSLLFPANLSSLTTTFIACVPTPLCSPHTAAPQRFLPTTFVSHLKWRGNASLWAHKWPILRAGWDWCLRSSCADLLPAPTGEWEITLRFSGEDAGQTGKETKVRERGTKNGMSCGGQSPVAPPLALRPRLRYLI